MTLSAPVRVLFVVLGFASLATGVAGAFLPLLPTTPFLLLAAFLFSRSSPRLHGWLMRNRFVGPAVERWERERTVSRRVKWTATAMCALSAAISVPLLPHPAGQAGLAAFLAVLVAVVWRLPERRGVTMSSLGPGRASASNGNAETGESVEQEIGPGDPRTRKDPSGDLPPLR